MLNCWLPKARKPTRPPSCAAVDRSDVSNSVGPKPYMNPAVGQAAKRELPLSRTLTPVLTNTCFCVPDRALKLVKSIPPMTNARWLPIPYEPPTPFIPSAKPEPTDASCVRFRLESSGPPAQVCAAASLASARHKAVTENANTLRMHTPSNKNRPSLLTIGCFRSGMRNHAAGTHRCPACAHMCSIHDNHHRSNHQSGLFQPAFHVPPAFIARRSMSSAAV